MVSERKKEEANRAERDDDGEEGGEKRTLCRCDRTARERKKQTELKIADSEAKEKR
jgi:hypothetical protein